MNSLVQPTVRARREPLVPTAPKLIPSPSLAYDPHPSIAWQRDNAGLRSESIRSARRLTPPEIVDLQSWLDRQTDTGPLTTNQPSEDLPFQRWFRLKEAFSPQFVVEAIGSLPFRPENCLDPFGGVGTTALSCQFLGITPITVEVNPFLADVIEAKLSAYSPSALMESYRRIRQSLSDQQPDIERICAAAPATLCEPGLKGRWIFDRPVLSRIIQYEMAIASLVEPGHRRLFRVLLASRLVKVSNILVNGKGRRYRKNWKARLPAAHDVDCALESAYREALFDVCRYPSRPEPGYSLLRGDCRLALSHVPEVDFAMFSPPYPNSFDYTDIYNVELWTLGYLRSGEDNRTLREATLRSHVQIKRSYDSAALPSRTLTRTLRALRLHEKELWNRDIPSMIAAYFGDLMTVLVAIRKRLTSRGRVMIVVGDSRYAGVLVPVGAILSEIAPNCGLTVQYLKPIRAMRASAQQGGRDDLGEALLCLARE